MGNICLEFFSYAFIEANLSNSLIHIVYIQHNLKFIIIVRNGHIKRITDPDIQSSVLEIMGTNVSTTYITAPAKKKLTLGIKLQFLVMIIKNV